MKQMRRFRSAIWMTIVVFAVAITLAWVIDHYVELPGPSLSTVTNVITAVTSVALFSIAVIVYRRFSGSQVILDKQTQKAVDFLTFLNQLNFSAEILDDSNLSIMNLHITDYKKRRKHFIYEKKDKRKNKNTFNYTTIAMMQKIDEYSRDPYMPKTIANRISARLAMGNIEVLTPPKDKLLVVSVRGNFNNRPPVFMADNGKTHEDYASLYQGLNQYIASLEDLMFELESVYQRTLSWLYANSPLVADSLNIEQVKVFNRKEDIL